MMETKQCLKCREIKPATKDYFYRIKASGHFRGKCKTCMADERHYREWMEPTMLKLVKLLRYVMQMTDTPEWRNVYFYVKALAFEDNDKVSLGKIRVQLINNGWDPQKINAEVLSKTKLDWERKKRFVEWHQLLNDTFRETHDYGPGKVGDSVYLHVKKQMEEERDIHGGILGGSAGQQGDVLLDSFDLQGIERH
jgi:hypothetical protein